jgi:hypothetical protein
VKPYQRGVSKCPILASPRKDLQESPEYCRSGPRGSWESLMTTIPVVEATSTQFPPFMLYFVFRQLRRLNLS